MKTAIPKTGVSPSIQLRKVVSGGFIMFTRLALAGWMLSAAAGGAAEAATAVSEELHFVSPGLEVRISAHAPGLDALNLDGLGLGKRETNDIRQQTSANPNFMVTLSTTGGKKKVDYRKAGQPANTPPP